MEHVSLRTNAINILQGYISSKFPIRENFLNLLHGKQVPRVSGLEIPGRQFTLPACKYFNSFVSKFALQGYYDDLGSLSSCKQALSLHRSFS